MKTCPQCHTTHPIESIGCASDGTTLVESDAWPGGTVIEGKYRILARLGRGWGYSVPTARETVGHHLTSFTGL